jgi:alginate O-acetyltransferase complex protein AlgI
MIYSTPEFFIFFGIIWTIYFIAGRGQNSRLWILIFASLFFYMWAGGVLNTLIFLFILLISWITVYFAERSKKERSKKLYLVGGIILMSIHLLIWKYLPWITETIQLMDPTFLNGKKIEFSLPLGISFFTLQGIAYLVDYGRNQAGYINLKEFILFKSFFPQLVAGPIVRMREISKQLRSLANANYENICYGLMLFTLGFFKKIAIADRMAVIVNPVFSNPSSYSASGILLATVAYAVQIWADFSGYTDMGRGAAKMLGINLPENFYSPYLSRSPSEFWRRWHVTLSQWIKDYIYKPMLGSDAGVARIAAVLLTAMMISGLWHGAAFTFIIWGFYHGVLLVLERCAGHWGLPIFKGKFAILFTFLFILFGWLIFRSESLESLLTSLKILVGVVPGGNTSIGTLSVVSGLFCCFIIQISNYSPLGQESKIKLYIKQIFKEGTSTNKATLIGLASGGILVLTLTMRVGNHANQFIYFQF